MNITELLSENRARGFVSVPDSVPLWAKSRILEIRAAVLDGRPIPAPSQRFISGCEQRSLTARSAIRFAKKQFRQPTVNAEDERLKTIAHRQYQEIASQFRAEGLPVNAAERAAVNAAENAKRRADALDILAEIHRIGATL